MDSKKHKQGTGKGNRLILENAARIGRSRPLRVRVPLIPGFNDSAEDIEAIARFVEEAFGPVPIDLLPYNKMGEGKYAFLDRDCQPLEGQDERLLERLGLAAQGKD